MDFQAALEAAKAESIEKMANRRHPGTGQFVSDDHPDGVATGPSASSGDSPAQGQKKFQSALSRVAPDVEPSGDADLDFFKGVVAHAASANDLAVSAKPLLQTEAAHSLADNIMARYKNDQDAADEASKKVSGAKADVGKTFFEKIAGMFSMPSRGE